MNPEPFSSSSQNPASQARTKQSKIEKIAFMVMMITVVIAPLSFLSTSYIALDAVKSIVIAVGTLVSAILYGLVVYKERSLILPPKSITWTSIIVGLSLVVSSLVSVHVGKSFFGQGFELTTASFTLILFVIALVTYSAITRKRERVPAIYLAMTVPFIILAILHLARLFAGSSFISLGVLTTVTSTLVGTWYDLAAYSFIIIFITLPALIYLPLSRRIRIIYWVLMVVAFVSAFIINSTLVWTVGTVSLLAFVIMVSLTRPRPAAGGLFGLLKRIAWLPLILLIISGLLAWKGTSLAQPVIQKFDAAYTSLTLPWQLTLDVDSGALKNSPLFGVGPNHFGQAYLAFKPAIINPTYAWNAEFNYAFSLLGTFVATQGIFGIIAWMLLFVFLGIISVKALCRLPSDPHQRFATVSSIFSALFLWVLAAFTVPSHVILFFTFVLTAIAVAVIVKNGTVSSLDISPRIGSLSRMIVTVSSIVLVVAGVLWLVVYIKDFSALSYFGSGVKSLTVSGDADAADAAFAKAFKLNTSDVYLQARAEAGLAKAAKLISAVKKDAPASENEDAAKEVFATVNAAINNSQAAIAYDPTNYYNFVSEARVSEFAAGIRMDKAYENAVRAYTEAIRRNPLNPALYLALAKLHASQNKLDEATRALGAALQVKNNYLDAVFLLSQVAAAQGNLRDAIIAAQFATQLNPQNPVLFFQLGLLHYSNKDYAEAAKSLATAVQLQPDYANAQYFLGLSYARQNDNANAIVQFSKLAEANPDNQEVSFILSNLRSGRSPFADAQPPVTPAPEKRESLPIKEKTKK